ncbi:ribbon-helix-helix domain-containing protein [Falsiroseomonas sp. CW058]|uniref:ribbon-helix-helix domain-containing protein n=1 Tax=Falsiroseomonas sp. CW058 TaxID=3388664 RepID=UPI003D31363D
MKAHLRKRSFRLAGHRTSVALEPEFWASVEAAAARRGLSLAALVAELDAARADAELPLASALRVFALREALAPPPRTRGGAEGGAG